MTIFRSLAAVFLSVSGASAQSGSCALVQESINAVATAPAYRQSTKIPSMPDGMEAVVIGDMIYARVDNKWNKIPLKPGGRKGMVEQFMSMSAVSDCKETGIEDLNGRKLRVVEYMMTAPKGMPGDDGKPKKHSLWVGQDDNRPYRLVSEGVEVDIQYENVTPPIP
jgi:hypothetical protein